MFEFPRGLAQPLRLGRALLIANGWGFDLDFAQAKKRKDAPVVGSDSRSTRSILRPTQR
jgi:hypothetical protein